MRLCLPHIKGTWELYSTQLQVAAPHYGWMAAVTATQLCLALERKAQQGLVDLLSEQRYGLVVLTAATQ